MTEKDGITFRYCMTSQFHNTKKNNKKKQNIKQKQNKKRLTDRPSNSLINAQQTKFEIYI